MNQRWNEGRDSYRPAGEVIRASEYDVAALDETTAKAFVTAHHYSRTYPAARLRFGLYRRAELVGVAVFSHPMSDKVLSIFPGEPRQSVPGNGETWFLARCFEELRAAGLRGVVSFSDPFPRTRADGSVVFAGHIGTIYQAHNARFLGRGTARILRLLPDGRVMSARAISKIRNGERGQDYAIAQLVSYGADAPTPGADLSAWVAAWVARLTRPMRHAGNYRYAWALDKACARWLPRSSAYPKAVAA
jgi:hypothetical protein